MHSFRYRLAYASAVAIAGQAVAIFAADSARADEQPLQATMSCDRAPEPGRMRCSIEAKVGEGRTIAWADVAILQLPEFATALKGRIGPSDATSREAASTKWAFGLVAKKAGQGEARARVRIVACEVSTSKCSPLTVEVRSM